MYISVLFHLGLWVGLLSLSLSLSVCFLNLFCVVRVVSFGLVCSRFCVFFVWIVFGYMLILVSLRCFGLIGFLCLSVCLLACLLACLFACSPSVCWFVRLIVCFLCAELMEARYLRTSDPTASSSISKHGVTCKGGAGVGTWRGATPVVARLQDSAVWHCMLVLFLWTIPWGSPIARLYGQGAARPSASASQPRQYPTEPCAHRKLEVSNETSN